MAAGAVARPLAKAAGKALTEDVLPSLTQSVEAVMSKFPAGKEFVQKFKSEYMPQVAKTAEQYASNLGWTRQDAIDVARRVVRPSFAGSRDQYLSNLIVEAEKARGPIYANTIADHINTIFHEHGVSKSRVGAIKAGVPIKGITSTVTPYNELEIGIRKGTSALSTSRIAIPHLSQPLNLILNTSYKPIFEGIAKFASNPNDARRITQASGALFDDLMYETRSSKWYRRLVQPGFSFLRQQQIALSGVTGKYSALDAAERLLKDPTDKYANVQLKFLGIKPTEVLANKGRLTDEQLDTAIYRMVDETMFLRSGLRTPALWEHNAAFRIATMYKHFAFTEAKAMKDALKRSAKQGPASFVRTIGALTVLFPAVGEGIKQLENFATQNPDDPKKRLGAGVFPDMVSRYIDDLAHVGGLGIGYQMIRSITRHQLAGYFLGPFFGGVMDLASDAWLGATNLGKGKEQPFRSLERDIVKKVPVIGVAASNKMFPPKHSRNRPQNRRKTRKGR